MFLATRRGLSALRDRGIAGTFPTLTACRGVSGSDMSENSATLTRHLVCVGHGLVSNHSFVSMWYIHQTISVTGIFSPWGNIYHDLKEDSLLGCSTVSLVEVMDVSQIPAASIMKSSISHPEVIFNCKTLTSTRPFSDRGPHTNLPLKLSPFWAFSRSLLFSWPSPSPLPVFPLYTDHSPLSSYSRRTSRFSSARGPYQPS